MQGELDLESILQIQLSSDTLATVFLPSILITLSTAQLSKQPSHTNKWIARITALMQSKDKDVGARWTGICLAKKTLELRRDLIVECAQRWINLTLPLLSKSEHPAIWKASIDLLTFIFTESSHLSEFRRQVSTPTVPKLSFALLELLNKGDSSVNILAMSSLSIMIERFPTLHRSLTTQIISSAANILSTGAPFTSSLELIETAAHLLASVHFIDGKVGAPLAWRNMLDCTINESWKCVSSLQSTLNTEPIPVSGVKKVFEFPALPSDPITVVRAAVGRLENLITLTGALFRINQPRPVAVPISNLVALTMRLLRSGATRLPSSTSHDALRLQLELQVVPVLVKIGADLTKILISSLQHNIIPHILGLTTSVAYQLEQKPTPSLQTHLLQTLRVLLDNTTIHDPHIPIRLFRLVAPLLSPLLPEARAISSSRDSKDANAVNTATADTKKSKGKKRAREFGGEELMNQGLIDVIQDGDVILEALEVLRRILRLPQLPASTHSIGTRLILSLSLQIANQSPRNYTNSTTRNVDDTFYTQIQAKLLEIQGELSLGTGGHAWRGMNISFASIKTSDGNSSTILAARLNSLQILDALIHPRLPPALRSLPQAESLMLFRDEESKEEREEREASGLLDGMTLGMALDDEMYNVQQSHDGSTGKDVVSGVNVNILREQQVDVEMGGEPLAQVQEASLPMQTNLSSLTTKQTSTNGLADTRGSTLSSAPTKPFGSFGVDSTLFGNNTFGSATLQSPTAPLTTIPSDKEDLQSIEANTPKASSYENVPLFSTVSETNSEQITKVQQPDSSSQRDIVDIDVDVDLEDEGDDSDADDSDEAIPTIDMASDSD